LRATSWKAIRDEAVEAEQRVRAIETWIQDVEGWGVGLEEGELRESNRTVRRGL